MHVKKTSADGLCVCVSVLCYTVAPDGERLDDPLNVTLHVSHSTEQELLFSPRFKEYLRLNGSKALKIGAEMGSAVLDDVRFAPRPERECFNLENESCMQSRNIRSVGASST